MARRSITSTELRNECALLEKEVLRQGLATVEDLAQHRPGGGSNPQTDVHGWKRFLIVLHRRHAKAEIRSDQASALKLDDLHAADFATLRVLAGVATPLDLVSLEPAANGRPQRTVVYPKCGQALIELHDRERAIGYLNAHREVHAKIAKPESLEAVQRLSAEILYQYNLAYWGMTFPGLGLPWSEEDSEPRPPETVRLVGLVDVLRVIQTFNRINTVNDRVLEQLLLPPDGKTKDGARRPTLAGFLSLLSFDSGIPSPRLFRDWHLVGILEGARLAADQRDGMHRQALAEAKRAADKGGEDLRRGA